MDGRTDVRTNGQMDTVPFHRAHTRRAGSVSNGRSTLTDDLAFLFVADDGLIVVGVGGADELLYLGDEVAADEAAR